MSERNFTLSIAAQPLTALTEFDPEDEYRPEPEPEALPPVWLDGSVRIGIHTSIAGGHRNALETARRLGCNALQIFSANPRQWQSGPSRIPEAEARAFRVLRTEMGLGPLVVHANYLINLASPQPMLRVRSIQAFHDEIVRAMALGADFLVVHPGTRGEATCAQAVSTVIESVKQASKRGSLGGMKILLENTAGMGSCLSSRLEEMAEILAGLRDFPVEVCLDTAHLFAAGYELRTEQGLAATIGQIENTVGLERVPVMHINDSKIPLGGRVDRHEHVGRGKIGAEAFRRILMHPRLGTVPPEGVAGRAFILETPIDDPGDDRRNVAALWELAGLKESAPEAEKGFSMLTPALKKKMDARVVEEKRVAAVVARKAAVGGAIEERSLHSASRLLRRSEAEKQGRRLAPVGMTGVARGARGAKAESIPTKLGNASSAAGNTEDKNAARKGAVLAKKRGTTAAKSAAKKSGAKAKKSSGASTKRKRG